MHIQDLQQPHLKTRGSTSWRPARNRVRAWPWRATCWAPMARTGCRRMKLGHAQSWWSLHGINGADMGIYPPVNQQFAIENCNRNSWFTELNHVWFSIVYQRVTWLIATPKKMEKSKILLKQVAIVSFLYSLGCNNNLKWGDSQDIASMLNQWRGLYVNWFDYCQPSKLVISIDKMRISGKKNASEGLQRLQCIFCFAEAFLVFWGVFLLSSLFFLFLGSGLF